MLILLSNDDGVHALGLKAMYDELKKLGQVWVAAPLEEKSTTGHSLTLHKPLRVIKMTDRFFGVSGSPADCVYIGIREIIGKMPDLVVSGINRGANLGQDVYYSGTVSAAREACILGLPSMAVSLAVDFATLKDDQKLNYSSAAKVATRLLRQIDLKEIPQHTLLNVNVPDLPIGKIKDIHWTRQGFRFYSGNVLKRKDHRGRNYYWVGGQYKGFRNDPDTDCGMVDRKHVSVTPVKLDTTDFDFLSRMRDDGPILKK